MVEDEKERDILWSYRYRMIGVYFLNQCQMSKGLKYMFKVLPSGDYLKTMHKLVRCAFIKLVGSKNFQTIRKNLKKYEDNK